MFANITVCVALSSNRWFIKTIIYMNYNTHLVHFHLIPYSKLDLSCENILKGNKVNYSLYSLWYNSNILEIKLNIFFTQNYVSECDCDYLTWITGIFYKKRITFTETLVVHCSHTCTSILILSTKVFNYLNREPP